jgi:hypothetical protein
MPFGRSGAARFASVWRSIPHHLQGYDGTCWGTRGDPGLQMIERSCCCTQRCVLPLSIFYSGCRWHALLKLHYRSVSDISILVRVPLVPISAILDVDVPLVLVSVLLVLAFPRHSTTYLTERPPRPDTWIRGRMTSGTSSFASLSSWLWTAATERSATEVIATCSTPSSRPSGCARPVQTATAAQGSPHDHQGHEGYRQATPASNAGDARSDVMVRNHAGNASGTSTLRHAVTRSLHKELCPAGSEHSRTRTERVVLIVW